MSIIEHCGEAWRVIRTKRFPFLIMPVIDLIFFVVLGFVTAPLFDRIVLYAQSYFGSLAGPQLVDASLRGESLINPLLLKLFLLYFILLLTFYAIYCLFQGFSWGLAARMFDVPLSEYLRKFAVANMLWVPLYGVIHMLDLAQLFQSAAAERFGLEAPNLIPAIMVTLSLLLIYFAFTDYALLMASNLSLRKRIAFAFRNGRIFLPIFFFFGLLFFAGNAVLLWVFSRSAVAGMVIGIVILLPLFSFFRLVLNSAATTGITLNNAHEKATLGVTHGNARTKKAQKASRKGS